MIRVICSVAMDYSLIPDRSLLEQLPKGQTLVFGAKMAKALGGPIRGQNCIVLDAMGVRGWGRTDTIPDDCVVCGGGNVIEQGLGVATEVLLIVQPVSTSGRPEIDLIDFLEVGRVAMDDGVTCVTYTRMLT